MGLSPRPRPFGTLGWSLAGGLALSLSLPPVGFYPLAWVALVPLLSRWADRKASFGLAREIYAVFLVAAAATGFWALHLPNQLQAALAGVALLLVPIPVTAAFWGASWVREKFGMRLGLVALVVDILAAEFLTLHLPIGTPWTLLGHTQALALPFIQMVELGGVLILSVWVLGLNVAAFFAVEASRNKLPVNKWADRGLAATVFATLIVLPAVYGTVRTSTSDVPPGHVRVAIAQPDLPLDAWDEPMDEERVAHLARVSDALLAEWSTQAAGATASRVGYSTAPDRPDLLIWPRSALPLYGDIAREKALYDRLDTWAARRRTPLLTGALTARSNDGRATPEARYYPLPMSKTRQSVLLFHPAHDGVIRYDQSRRVPLLEGIPNPISRSVGDAVPAFSLGSNRRLLPAGRTQLAATVGYESVFGDHVRRFVGDGANLLVALAPASGGLAGRRQHLAFIRLRALETGRAVVVAAPNQGSALVLPDGRTTQLVSTTVPEGVRVEAPVYSGTTPYVRWGDWVGYLAFLIALVGHGVMWQRNKKAPKKTYRKSIALRRLQQIPT